MKSILLAPQLALPLHLAELVDRRPVGIQANETTVGLRRLFGRYSLDAIPTSRYDWGMVRGTTSGGPVTASTNARDKLVQAGIDRLRRCGFVATTVDEICGQAGVTKGAFFHHFPSKEALAEACLAAWDQRFQAMHEQAPFQSIEDPLEKLLACIDFYVDMFSKPTLVKSCLVGTTVQEVSESHPVLRDAAQFCFANGERMFQRLLDEACRSRGIALDTASLAKLWMATIQGSLVLHKASGDDAVIPNNLQHFKQYVQTLFCE